jgi:type IV pilus assembly protein PilC
MPQFFYKARDPQGMPVSGSLDAASIDEVQQSLGERGLIPISVRQASGGFDFSSFSKIFQERIAPEEMLVMTRQFYTLFKAGMSMEAVFATLVKQATNKRLKESLQRIRNSLGAGSSLSKAFAGQKEVFGELYTSMLAAGEEAGILEGVLGNISQILEKEMQINSSVKSATMYPKIVVFVLVGAMMVVMTVVVPKFASFFAHYKAELPLPTRMLMGFSNFVTSYWYIALGIVLFCVFAYKRYAKTSRGKLKLGDLRLRMPVFGMLNTKVANSRFCHILSALYRSGMSMTRALEITAGTIDNGAFHREMDFLRMEVTQGKTLSEGMANCKYFTPIIVDATAIGEKTGALDEMLESMGSHYDIEVQHTVKNLTTLLEPFMLFMIFGMVTVFALAIFLPIWNMSRAVSGRH